MSGICGWIGGVPALVQESECCSRMGALLARFDGSTVRARQESFGAFALASLPGEFSDIHADNERIAAIWGRADIDDSSDRSVASESPARALADGFAKHGAEILSSVF